VSPEQSTLTPVEMSYAQSPKWTRAGIRMRINIDLEQAGREADLQR
jgi:hypothetical protein